MMTGGLAVLIDYKVPAPPQPTVADESPKGVPDQIAMWADPLTKRWKSTALDAQVRSLLFPSLPNSATKPKDTRLLR